MVDHDADCALLLGLQHLVLAPHTCCEQSNPLKSRYGRVVRCTSLNAPGEASQLDTEQGSAESRRVGIEAKALGFHLLDAERHEDVIQTVRLAPAARGPPPEERTVTFVCRWIACRLPHRLIDRLALDSPPLVAH